VKIKQITKTKPLTMETNETFERPSPAPGLALNFEAQSYLREAGKWAYFLGIIGFILTGFIFLAAFFVGAVFSLFSRLEGTQSSFGAADIGAGIGGIIISFIYIVLAVFYFFFSYYLYQFGNRIKKGLLFSDSTEVTFALGKLKSFFRMWGITTIVILSLYALIFVIFIVAAIATASMSR
jgi:Family of unknown function (DUF5362)